MYESYSGIILPYEQVGSTPSVSSTYDKELHRKFGEVRLNRLEKIEFIDRYIDTYILSDIIHD